MTSDIQSAEDVAAISRLKYRYCELADGGWDKPSHDSDALGQLFVENGSWSVLNVDGERIYDAHGRDEIARCFESFKRVPTAMHYVSNPEINVKGDKATGRWHVVACLTDSKGRAQTVLGIYDDEYVKVPSVGWRFVSCQTTIRARLAMGETITTAVSRG